MLVAAVVMSAALGCAAAGDRAGSADARARGAQAAVHERFMELLAGRDLRAAADLLHVPSGLPADELERRRSSARHTLRLLTVEFGLPAAPTPAERGVRFFHVRFEAAPIDVCPRVVGMSNVSKVEFSERGTGYVRTRMCAGSEPPRISVVAYGLPAEREGARAEIVEVCAAMLLAMRDARSADEARDRCEADIPARV